MVPMMSEKELELFTSFLRKSQKYVEFGTGGSTYLASRSVQKSVISLDSSQEWLEKVRLACADNPVQPTLVFADIGPVGDFGNPTDPSLMPQWLCYHEILWDLPESRKGDLYMVDGRFRNACFAQTILHCPKNAVIGIHDFASRPHYHVAYDIAREIACAEDMSFFVPLDNVEDAARAIIRKYRFDPR